MRTALCALFACLASPLVHAYDMPFKYGDNQNEVCSGIWASQNAFINVTFDRDYGRGQVELLVFEVGDYQYLGRNGAYICNPWNIKSRVCTEEERGHYLFSLPEGVSLSNTSIWTTRLAFPNTPNHMHTASIEFQEANNVHSSQAFLQATGQEAALPNAIEYSTPVQYPVRKTGYYCVWYLPVLPGPPYNHPIIHSDYRGVALFRSALPGKLSAADQPRLIFYAVAFSLYSVLGLVWGAFYWKHRQDTLPIQKSLTRLLGLVVLDELFTLTYLALANAQGRGNASIALHFVAETLRAARHTYMLFVLLLMFRGFSALRDEDIPKDFAKKSTFFFFLHVAFGAFYGWGNVLETEYPAQANGLTTANQLQDTLVLLAPTTAIFVCWILYSWMQTMQHLASRDQIVLLHKYIYAGIIFVLALALYAAFRSFLWYRPYTHPGHTYPEADEWQLRWLVDEWPDMVYLPVLANIIFLWRPTERNIKAFAYEELTRPVIVRQASQASQDSLGSILV